MDHDIAITFCKAVFDGTPKSGLKFHRFLFPDVDASGKTFETLLCEAVERVQQNPPDTWEGMKIAIQSQLSTYDPFANTPAQCSPIDMMLLSHTQFTEALMEFENAPRPDFERIFRELTVFVKVKFERNIDIESLVTEFSNDCISKFRACFRSVKAMCAESCSLQASTIASLKYRFSNPDSVVVGKILEFIKTMLKNVMIARSMLLNIQLPVFTPLAILIETANGKTISSNTPLRLRGQISPTLGLPGYLNKSSSNPVEVMDLINSIGPQLSSNIIGSLFAARTWAVYRDMTNAPPDLVMPSVGAPIEGGAKKTPKKKPSGKKAILGGAGHKPNARKKRAEVNSKFGKKFFKHVGDMAKHVSALVKDNSHDLVNFFSDPSNRPLIVAFCEIKVPSRGYIPTLSGFYRTPEAKARRERYIGDLKKLIQSIEKIGNAKMGGSAKNNMQRSKETAQAMIRSINEANREIESIFSKLKSGEASDVTGNDSDMANGKSLDTKEPSSYEAGGYSGAEHTALSKALENLKSVSKISASKKDILAGLDKLEDYIKNSKSISEEAKKKRFEELTLSYHNVLGKVAGPMKELAKKVIDFKLKTYNEFYAVLAETELYLAKSHKELIMTPAIRQELYEALSSWTIASKTSSRLNDRFEGEVKQLAATLFNQADSVFYYSGQSLGVRPLGGTPGDETANDERASSDSKLYDTFRHNLLTMLNYCPQLHLVFKLVNILEKVFKRGYDEDKFYSVAARFIIAASVDVCERGEALTVGTAAQTLAGGFSMIGKYAAGPAAPAANAAGTEYWVAGGDDGQTESTEETGDIAGTRHADHTGVYFRHSISHVRLEDHLFARWMKAICANLLLSLDRDRATHGIKQVRLPGAERLLLGGGIDDPIGITGSRDVTPEATALYFGFREACGAYEAYYTWESEEKLGWSDTDEPRLVIEVPRDSRYYVILELVRGKKSKEALSETYISQLVAAVDVLLGHFSHISDPEKKVTAIFDSFFEEINNSILLRMMMDHTEAEAQKSKDRDVDAISGIPPFEDRIEKVDQTAEAHRDFRKKILGALKGIAMSVFDIMSKVGTSEEIMANDYKAYIDRIQKRLTEVKAEDRFRELVRAMQSPDDSIGDLQGLFMAFVEFVVTPMFFLTSVTENVVYRMTNLNAIILRNLYAARYMTAAAPPVMERVWFDAQGIENSHREHLDAILDGFQATVGAVAGRENRHAFIQVGAKWFLRMQQPIYKALSLVQDIGGDYVKITKSDGHPKVDISRLIAFIDDSVTDVKAALGVFMKIGKKSHAEKYFKDITAWEPKMMLNSVSSQMNQSLSIVANDFCALRDYLPNAVCFDHTVAHQAAAPYVGRGWVVNYRRNALLNTDGVKALVNYHEAVEYIIGAPSNWGSIREVMQGANGTGSSFTEKSWSSLETYHGIFNPIVKMGNKVGPGTGLMPWTKEDSKVIEGGWDSSPSHGRVLAGAALNTAALSAAPSESISFHVGDHQSLNSGGWVLHDAGQSDMQLGYINRGGGAGDSRLTSVDTGANVMSLLYGNRPSYGTKAETFNRLMAKMATSLAIQGEAPVVLYDLAYDITNHPSLSTYFQTTNFSVAGDRPDQTLTYTFFTEAIGTPVRIRDGEFLMHCNDKNWIISPDGVASAMGDTPAMQANLANDRRDAPTAFGAAANAALPAGIAPVGASVGSAAAVGVFGADPATSNIFRAARDAQGSGATLSNVNQAVGLIFGHLVRHAGVANRAAMVALRDQLHRWADTGDLGDTTTLAADVRPLLPAGIQANYQNIEGNVFVNTFNSFLRFRRIDFLERALRAGTGAIPGRDGNGNEAPEYKPGTFFYDTSLIPFFNSAQGVSTKRLGEMSPSEMAKYLAAIPQLMTAFKTLKCQMKMDKDLELGDDRLLQRAASVGAPSFVSNVGGNFTIDAIGGGPNNLKDLVDAEYRAIEGIVECLSRCYRSIREKYGDPVHMEMVKGDFEPYQTAGKFDASKITTPIASSLGMTLVGANGPVSYANFGERGSEHSDTAMALSWATPVGHKELVNMEVVPFDSVPWSMAMSERLKRMTHASLDTVFQPIVTRIAKFICMQNTLTLSALACNNPWGTHSVPSMVFHPHILKLSIASMNAGIDLLRPVNEGNYGDTTDAHHWLVEMALPWAGAAIKAPAGHLSLHAPVSGGKPYYDVPHPIYDASTAVQVHALSSTANPWGLDADGRKAMLLQTSIRNPPVARLWGGNPVVVYGHDFIDLGAGNVGSHIAAILTQLEKNPYDHAHIEKASIDKYFHNHIQAFGHTEPTSDYKRIGKWTANRTKDVELIKQQFGFKLPNDELDGAYIEMIRFSPPKSRWADELTVRERRMAGFFMYMKRNPLSILAAYKLTPFPSIYAHSEAFDLYFNLAAYRESKNSGSAKVRSHVPSLIVNPLSPSRKYVDYASPGRQGETWILPDTSLWDTAPTSAKRKVQTVRIHNTVRIANGLADGIVDVKAYQSFRPAEALTSIPQFYDVKFVPYGLPADTKTGFSAPSEEAIRANNGLVSFPLFAMHIRMLDQFGITLKEELAARLREIKYDRPDSLAPHQNALIGILGE